jgi:hypothetical protein
LFDKQGLLRQPLLFGALFRAELGNIAFVARNDAPVLGVRI